MAKTYLSHAKYVIHQKFEIKGVVDKHDIIGAIFGQSEGIIGEDLDLRELQGSGKIGRIEIELESRNGVTNGTLTIPSGSDMVETSILAATIEVVDKVGPCDAFFNTVKIEDTRITKRKQIIDRAKSLLSKLVTEEIPDSQEIANEVRSEVRTSEITEYGPDRLPAGPHIADTEEIILVEGRADVLNLLKYNIRNVVAMGGSKIPPAVVELCRQKTVISFIDGDRGGELDLKRLLQIAEIDYIARAPPGREVEELTKKEILAALSKKIPVVQTKAGEKVAVDDLELGSGKYWENSEKELEAFDEKPTDYVKEFAKPNVSIKESGFNNTSNTNNYPHGGFNRGYNTNNNNSFNRNHVQQRRDYKSYENKPQERQFDKQEHYQEKSFDNRVQERVFEKPVERAQENKSFEPKPFERIEAKPFERHEHKFESRPEIRQPERRPERVVDNKQQFTSQPLRNDSDSKNSNQIPKDINVDVSKDMKELKNTLKSRFYDKDGKLVSEVLVRDIIKALKDKKQDTNTILFDGIATKRLVELAKNKGVKYLVCAKQGKMSYIKGIEVFEYEA